MESNVSVTVLTGCPRRKEKTLCNQSPPAVEAGLSTYDQKTSRYQQEKGRRDLDAARVPVGGRGGLTEELDVDLLEGVAAAELVELMVDLVKDESLVVICGEVPHNVID